jgi:hypothetical protein
MVRRLRIQRTPPTSFDYRLQNAFSNVSKINGWVRSLAITNHPALDPFLPAAASSKQKPNHTHPLPDRWMDTLCFPAPCRPIAGRRWNQSDCAESRMRTAGCRAIPDITICSPKKTSRQNSHNLYFTVWKQGGALLKRLVGHYRQRQMPSAYQPLKMLLSNTDDAKILRSLKIMQRFAGILQCIRHATGME